MRLSSSASAADDFGISSRQGGNLAIPATNMEQTRENQERTDRKAG